MLGDPLWRQLIIEVGRAQRLFGVHDGGVTG
jgi:hypothetical protein